MRLLLLLTLAFSPACYLKSYPVTASVAEDSTYEMFSAAGRYQGTAWVVSDGYLITAGHMCEPLGPYQVVSGQGRHVAVDFVEWTMTPGPEGDVCLLRAHGALNRPLVLATGLPAKGTADGYVGWPEGVFGSFKGEYMGDVGSSAACDHGASGSAFYTSAGVYGVLTQLRNPLELSSGCVGTPVTEVIKLLDENHVSYTTTPDDPTGMDSVFDQNDGG